MSTGPMFHSPSNDCPTLIVVNTPGTSGPGTASAHWRLLTIPLTSSKTMNAAAPAFSALIPLGYQGWGWKPNSKISISLWNEPDGPGSASTDWKYLFDVDADSYGMFGFSSNSTFYPVHRAICGNPENGQTVVFMAKSLTTGTVRMHWPGADIYFTFQPCP